MKRFCLVAMLLITLAAHAGGPRWVAGAKWTRAGKPMTWYRNDVQYFVDSGPLSASVDHDSAVALVDAAAAPWTLSTLPFSLKNGGTLGEDVNADTVYLGANGMVWPTDVSSNNYTAKQIAVVLDADGAVTDALLGSGASAPANCRTSAVTETVDLFIQPGSIAHAIIVVNGRCSGPAKEQQLQLQYQLMRVFGRVIGLGWSQLNDNVFTGVPTPTYAQMMHWPIMHPMDVLCSQYTYQCLPQPFTLRDDDISAMWQLYADATSSLAAANMIRFSGSLSFSGNNGMAGVNVVARRYQRWSSYGVDQFQDVSAVSGYTLSTQRGNPVTGYPADAGTGGVTNAGAGAYLMGAVNLGPGPQLVLTTEAINPLYVGAYAVGPYRMGSPAPSGLALNLQQGPFGAGGQPETFQVITNAATDCTTGADGTEVSPAALPIDGTWTGRLCAAGHTSWFGFAVKSGRTATLEVTATDETGAATTQKAMPLTGLWHGSDGPGVAPDVAASPIAFNALRAGTTQLRATFSTAEIVRLAVTDARGDGRPDYTYRLRVLYADAAAPSRLPSAGGAVSITGTGFTRSTTVTIGGVAARVVSASATQLQIVAPSASEIRSTGAKDVVVTDTATGATATISGGVVYAGASTDIIRITAQPAASVAVGTRSPFAVVVSAAGGAPVGNAEVVVSATAGSITVGACNLASCRLVTDANGIAATTVVANAPGSIAVQATTAGGATASISFTATDSSRALALLRPSQYVAAGVGVVFHPAVTVIASGGPSAGQGVAWTSPSPRLVLSGSSTSGSDGVAASTATGSLRDGESTTVQACAWTSVCAAGTVTAVAASDLRVAAVSGDAQVMTAASSLNTVVFRVQDAAGHPVAGASVGIYQAVSGWQPPCTAGGRCASAPVYGKSISTAISDDDGLVAVTPLQYGNTAAFTKITATAGTFGALTVTLEKAP